MDYLAQLESDSKEQEQLEKLVKKKLRLQQQLQTLEKELADHSVDTPTTQKHVQEFTQVVEAFKLLGVSTYIKDGSLFLRFDPVYKNQSKSNDFYCVEINGRLDKGYIGQHNLPPFIPVKNLEESFLVNGKIEEFVENIQTYLYSYTQRREGVQHVKTEFKSKGILRVDIDVPVTYVCVLLTLNQDWPGITVTLNFDMLKTSPYSVEIDIDDSVDVSAKDRDRITKLISRWKPQLIHHDIYTAFSKLLNDS